jgi:hypothetical protein
MACKEKLPKQVNAAALSLGDVIDLGFAPWGFATVRKLNEDGSVQVLRPYVVRGNFSYTGGVLVSLGFEDFAIRGNVTLVENGPELL